MALFKRITNKLKVSAAWWRRWLKIALAEDKVAAKEDYLTGNPDPDWWAGHLSVTLLKEAREQGWLAHGHLGDLGCNQGAFTVHAARLGWRMTGIDLNASALAVARLTARAQGPELASRLSFICARFGLLPLEDASLDGAMMFDAIEHIYPSQRPQALQELQRVLKPGARLLIVTPYGHAYDDGLQHVAFFDETSLGDALSGEGWNLLWVRRDQRQDIHAPLGHDRMNALVERV